MLVALPLRFPSLLCVLVLVVAMHGPVRAAQPPVLLGFDGAYGLLDSTSAQAIELGIRTALAEINAAGGVLDGRPLTLVVCDNRSVPARGVANIRALAAVPDLVAVVGGRFSPVLLQALPVVHELGIPLLDAWGSADGITRHDYRPSWSFRLSLRDDLAMPAMISHAAALGARRLGVLLPNTGWGRSNLGAAQRHHAANPTPELLAPVWYNWGEEDMLRHYRSLLERGADVVILVANDIEGGRLVRQLGGVDATERLPIVSHWGVTGGKMVQRSGPTLHELDFSVVQTFSLFRADAQLVDRVMETVRDIADIGRIEDIVSPVGFGHAYDLTHILARAVDIAGATDRAAVRDALEQVRDYRGLTGFYRRPFAPGDHDAMGPEHVFIARFRQDGVIVPLDWEKQGQ